MKPISICEGNRSSIAKITPTWNVLQMFLRNFPPAKITTFTVYGFQHYWFVKFISIDEMVPMKQFHTCEPPDGRMNSPVFLGHLPFSNILPYSPDFYMFLPYSPDFYMFTSRMCNLHHVHLGQGNKMQFE